MSSRLPPPLLLLMNVPIFYVRWNHARFNSQLHCLQVLCFKQISYPFETIYPSIKRTGQILCDSSWQMVDSLETLLKFTCETRNSTLGLLLNVELCSAYSGPFTLTSFFVSPSSESREQLSQIFFRAVTS